jgi:hypothetical protein
VLEAAGYRTLALGVAVLVVIVAVLIARGLRDDGASVAVAAPG